MTEGLRRHAARRDPDGQLPEPAKPSPVEQGSSEPGRPAPRSVGRHAAPAGAGEPGSAHRVPRQFDPGAPATISGRNGHGGHPSVNGHAGAQNTLPAGGQRARPATDGPTAQRWGQHAAAGSASRLRLVWVYPDLLSTYGDRGNLLILERRALLRGIQVEPVEVDADRAVPAQGDIYLVGGGEDLPQILAANRLRSDGGLVAAASRGSVVFAVCAGYQLIGHQFGGVEGEPVAGLGLLDVTSGRGERRGVGELVADVAPELGVPRLTGFENHQGITTVGSGARPLAVLSKGVGNGNGTEGAYAGRVLGTYMHGPALARNPGLADLLLSWVVGQLPPIDPAAERWAARLRSERLAAVSQ